MGKVITLSGMRGTGDPCEGMQSLVINGKIHCWLPREEGACPAGWYEDVEQGQAICVQKTPAEVPEGKTPWLKYGLIASGGLLVGALLGVALSKKRK